MADNDVTRKDGHTIPDNLQMLCRACNLKKSNL